MNIGRYIVIWFSLNTDIGIRLKNQISVASINTILLYRQLLLNYVYILVVKCIWTTFKTFLYRCLLFKWWIYTHWIILGLNFSLSILSAEYFHLRIVEAQHVDHVWIAENSIFLHEMFMIQTFATWHTLTCLFSKNITALLKSLMYFSVDLNWLFWIRKNIKRM